jgi:hypothetical protein
MKQLMKDMNRKKNNERTLDEQDQTKIKASHTAHGDKINEEKKNQGKEQLTQSELYCSIFCC